MEESFPELFGAPSGEGEAERTGEIVSRFAHKLNNVTATILGKAELARLAVKQGKVQDSEGKLLAALEAIEGAVARIGEALEILQALPGLKKEQ